MDYQEIIEEFNVYPLMAGIHHRESIVNKIMHKDCIIRLRIPGRLCRDYAGAGRDYAGIIHRESIGRWGSYLFRCDRNGDPGGLTLFKIPHYFHPIPK